jgi:hypothetical protein
MDWILSWVATGALSSEDTNRANNEARAQRAQAAYERCEAKDNAERRTRFCSVKGQGERCIATLTCRDEQYGLWLRDSYN